MCVVFYNIDLRTFLDKRLSSHLKKVCVHFIGEKASSFLYGGTPAKSTRYDIDM